MLPRHLTAVAALFAASSCAVAASDLLECANMAKAEFAAVRGVAAAYFPAVDFPASVALVATTPGGVPAATQATADGKREVILSQAVVCYPGRLNRRDFVRYLVAHELAHAVRGRDELPAYKLGAALALRSGTPAEFLARIAGNIETAAAGQGWQTDPLFDYPDGRSIAAAIRVGAGLDH